MMLINDPYGNGKFFQDFQKFLLKVANSEVGRYSLGIKPGDKRPVVEVSPYHFSQLEGYEGRQPLLTGRFYTYERQAKILMPGFIKMREAGDRYAPYKNPLAAYNHFAFGIRARGLPQVYLKTLSYYGGAGDGYAGNNNGSFSSCIGGNGNSSNYNETTAQIGFDYTNQFWCKRGFFPFNTSAIRLSSRINAVIAHVRKNAVLDYDNDGYDYAVWVAGNQADTGSLADSDYQGIGSTKLSGTQGFGSVPSDIALTFNSTGRDAIVKDGWSKLGMREGHDIDNHQLESASNTTTKLWVNTADSSGTSNDPYLAITYAPKVGSQVF